MFSQQNKTAEKVGERVGILFSYFLFTTMLFFILTFLKKIPATWSYTHIMGITLGITLCGRGLQRWLR